jgi:hypothetical protein
VFAADRPDLATLGSTMLAQHGIVYLATVSKAGRPRITPISVVFDQGSLFVSLIGSTPKCRELQAYPFFHLHALPGARGEEFSVRGWARVAVDAAELASIRKAHAASGVICDRDDLLFELLLDSAHYASFTRANGDLTATRESWTPKQGVLPEPGKEGGEPA